MMKIGLDLDGTLYSHPEFFSAMILSMAGSGHQFFCISSHGRNQWDDDILRLSSLGIPASLISPELMNPVQHGDLGIKGRAASQCDIVFDDDQRLAQFTVTPVMSPISR